MIIQRFEKSKWIYILTFLILLIVSIGCENRKDVVFEKQVLSPENWSEEQWSKARLSETDSLGSIVGDSIMLINTGSPEAAYSGMQVLKHGGSAIDAAITAALTDITIKTGQSVSFAGFTNLLYYEAKTGKVYSMNAGWNAPMKESDPASIPDFMSMTPSGRTALVPGFMKGIESAHQKFGKLPFDALFEPSIYFAENGIVVDNGLKFRMDMWQGILGRLDETKEIFVDKKGELLVSGDTLKQPKLANTLRKIANQGADYMYLGDWAKHFVDKIQDEGGYMTLDDLKNYEVKWGNPVHTDYRGYDIYGLAHPSNGGVNIIEAMNILEQVEIKELGHYTESAEALFLMLRSSRMADVFGTSFTNSPMDSKILNKYFPRLNLDSENRASKEHARELLQYLKSPEWTSMIQEDQNTEGKLNTGHSDAIVAIDAEGNIVSLIHSSNTMFWGRSGIFVNGISIPDPGATNQEEMIAAGPGNRLLEATPPVIVLNDNKPYLVSNSISMGVHELTFQNLVNIIDFNMSPNEANRTAHFAPSLLQSPSVFEFAKTFMPFEGNPEGIHVQSAIQGKFPQELLLEVRAMGEPMEELPNHWYDTVKGMWIGILINQESQKFLGTTADQYTGSAFSD